MPPGGPSTTVCDVLEAERWGIFLLLKQQGRLPFLFFFFQPIQYCCFFSFCLSVCPLRTQPDRGMYLSTISDGLHRQLSPTLTSLETTTTIKAATATPDFGPTMRKSVSVRPGAPRSFCPVRLVVGLLAL